MAEHMTVCGGHLTAGETASQIFSHAKVDKDKIFDNLNIQLSCFKNVFGIFQKM